VAVCLILSAHRVVVFATAQLSCSIWPSWCNCHSLSLVSVKSRLVLVSAHLGNPEQIPESHKTDVCTYLCCTNDPNDIQPTFLAYFEPILTQFSYAGYVVSIGLGFVVRISISFSLLIETIHLSCTVFEL